ncbi:hypothetical protein Q1695_000896 [Nippostrongylus brasiliensis]|nr:hypothetical protein Q1695_000896 [Nippostrongylus brasiliensis]
MQEDDTVSERNKISIDLLSEQKTQRMSSSTIIVFPCIIDLDNRLRRVSDVLFPHDLPRYNNLAMHYRSQAIDLVPIWQHEDTRVPARMLSYSMGSVETCRRERPELQSCQYEISELSETFDYVNISNCWTTLLDSQQVTLYDENPGRLTKGSDTLHMMVRVPTSIWAAST